MIKNTRTLHRVMFVVSKWFNITTRLTHNRWYLQNVVVTINETLMCFKNVNTYHRAATHKISHRAKRVQFVAP